MSPKVGLVRLAGTTAVNPAQSPQACAEGVALEEIAIETNRNAANLAGATLNASPGAMQLRTLQTIDGLGPTSSNTAVIAAPIEVMELVQRLGKYSIFVVRSDERA
jgi:hypothetical protein